MTNYKKAFTLAEIMIVLTIIAVITAVLLPAARHATPDENVMKFKKAHNTLTTAIRELVTSDKYYLDGDLGVKSDGTLISGLNAGDEQYFCKTLADILNAKKVNCTDGSTSITQQYYFFLFSSSNTLQEAQNILDEKCKQSQSEISSTIELSDGVIFCDTNPALTFGSVFHPGLTIEQSRQKAQVNEGYNVRFFGGSAYLSADGLDRSYKVFCMDLDGLNSGEDPFGYGIRYDGKILNGARATEWLEKSIQGGDE